MQYIKICWGIPGCWGISIRTSIYSSSLDYIQKLVEELKKDYPEAKNEDIQIVIYDTDSFKGMMGVEYFVTRLPDTKKYGRYTYAPCKF